MSVLHILYSFRLIEDMIYRIKCIQEENGAEVEEYIHDLDKTVSFIATELIAPSVDYEKKRCILS